MEEYYAHPRNQFWRLLAALYHEEVPQNYPDKKERPVDIPYSRLDSSSPAYTKSFELKLKSWEEIIGGQING